MHSRNYPERSDLEYKNKLKNAEKWCTEFAVELHMLTNIFYLNTLTIIKNGKKNYLIIQWPPRLLSQKNKILTLFISTKLLISVLTGDKMPLLLPPSALKYATVIIRAKVKETPNDVLINSERSEECIDLTKIITSRNNASISNFRSDYRWQSEYPWCIIDFQKNENSKKKKMTKKREILRNTSFRPNRFFDMVVIQKLITTIEIFDFLIIQILTKIHEHKNGVKNEELALKIISRSCLVTYTMMVVLYNAISKTIRSNSATATKTK
ncbi:Uncharacterized protein FWK35_00021883 [Aphis craccivora]|uniref:Uncharacterized protein n=1 Tax=Aphis craccivora TaxID=307492 RepID=A0A6G0VZU5_APHCR|nr:Uncharacterized protein FWK35_00021883 [Aphis craccivora]